MLNILAPSKEPLPISSGLTGSQRIASPSRATEPSGKCNEIFTRSGSLQYFASIEMDGRTTLMPWALRSLVSPKKVSGSALTSAATSRIDRFAVSSASHRALRRWECRRSVKKMGLSTLDSRQPESGSNRSQSSPIML